jgi:hypothetical protein
VSLKGRKEEKELKRQENQYIERGEFREGIACSNAGLQTRLLGRLALM